jgi:hypothetical protein
LEKKEIAPHMYFNGTIASNKTSKAYLITFADGCCQKSAAKCCTTGLATGRFESCVVHNMNSLDPVFIEQHAEILNQKRGRGYWIWKPYVILKTLVSDSVNMGDIVMYSDAGRHFVADPIEYFNVLWRKKNNSLYETQKLYREIYDSMERQDFFAFSMHTLVEKQWTKMNVLEAIAGMQSKKWKETFLNSPPASASFFIAKKSLQSIRFVGAWLAYCGDRRLVTDEKDQMYKNDPEFKENRHDQSILSALLKKWNAYFVECPGSGSPKSYLKKYEEAGFKHFMSETRIRE